MKIYTKVVIDIESGRTIEEESFEHQGDVALCKSGGAGGGSPTGTIAYPAYMQNTHNDWLNHTATDTMTYSVVDLMNAAMDGPSPFSEFSTVDVDEVFLGPYKNISNYIGPFDRLQQFSCFNLDARYKEFQRDEDTRVTDVIRAESALLEDDLDSTVIPRFQAGMANIGAVRSDAFVIGESLIRAAKVKQLAKNDAAIRLDRLNAQAEIALKRIAAHVDFYRLTTTLATEMGRIYVAARHDIDSLYTELKAKDRLFDLNIYQYGVNVMSSIAGSAVSPPDPGSNKSGLGGAISGALAGASAGYMIGGPWGAAAGGALGLAGAL